MIPFLIETMELLTAAALLAAASPILKKFSASPFKVKITEQVEKSPSKGVVSTFNGQEIAQ